MRGSILFCGHMNENKCPVENKCHMCPVENESPEIYDTIYTTQRTKDRGALNGLHRSQKAVHQPGNDPKYYATET